MTLLDGLRLTRLMAYSLSQILIEGEALLRKLWLKGQDRKKKKYLGKIIPARINQESKLIFKNFYTQQIEAPQYKGYNCR